MKNKKIVGIIIAIVIVIVCGFIIYNKTQKNNIANETTKIAVTKTDVKVNPTNTVQKPKMLTQKEIAEKEKEAAEKWKTKENTDKKYVTLEDVQNYIAAKSTSALIKEFPNEKGNERVLNAKIKAILKTTMTEKVLKDKFSLDGPTYDLQQFGVEIAPIGDLKFAFNINTNNLIANSNKDISITRTFSAE